MASALRKAAEAMACDDSGYRKCWSKCTVELCRRAALLTEVERVEKLMAQYQDLSALVINGGDLSKEAMEDFRKAFAEMYVWFDTKE